ncbi:DUF2652 domain-containing protein [Candidatus Berkelbacteria bacterium]|nr:DUF2652 domain-containing protein [Candidatus Berkelbacteria bacterium]
MPDTWQKHIERQEELVGSRHKGIILLGDISGYTALITQTALEHAQAIMQYLFDTIYQATGERFLVNELEGDAIFAYCVDPKDPQKLLAETLRQIHHYGDAFQTAKQDMLDRRAVDMKACPCNACDTIYKLSFKFIIHYGEFGLNQVGPFVKLIGSSVIAAHRLLKNDVPSDSYILMSNDALQFLPAAERAKFTLASEQIAHFGEVKIGYQLLDWGATKNYAGKVGQRRSGP